MLTDGRGVVFPLRAGAGSGFPVVGLGLVAPPTGVPPAAAARTAIPNKSDADLARVGLFGTELVVVGDCERDEDDNNSRLARRATGDVASAARRKGRSPDGVVVAVGVVMAVIGVDVGTSPVGVTVRVLEADMG